MLFQLEKSLIHFQLVVLTNYFTSLTALTTLRVANAMAIHAVRLGLGWNLPSRAFVVDFAHVHIGIASISVRQKFTVTSESGLQNT